ncbi:MAG: 23S rRNA (guanosine(2251)-2'-O)-methyltransferase RlmB [Salinisphaeraceae bacterium]|jgi:23S rRNA (guanosine2251-2'-O)-methyltransferase|nr:23S rRNA (guanosine(2251)-2'-O)-methyltransferase RlmB [Salinisphaeraceae bacterium]
MSDELIGGFHAVMAAVESGREVSEVLLRTGRDDRRAQTLMTRASERGVPVRRVSASELDARLPDTRHQGVAAVVPDSPALDEHALLALVGRSERPLLLALDQVQDPHNLGACLRTAAAAGCDAVILPRDRSAGLTAATRKVAAGGAEAVPVVHVTNLVRCIKRLQQAGCWVAGTDGQAEQGLYEADLTGPLLLVMGGEAEGLRRLTRESCDWLLRIPMSSAVQSLNVSVAAGICLFEARRQRSA